MDILWRFLKWRLGFTKKFEGDAPPSNLPPYMPQYAAPDIAQIQNPDPTKIQITWVGHSTFLIQTAGMNILTDPIWSNRASPISFLGPKRLSHPGLSFDQLPKIDVVLISHTHYDHLDRPTILKLGNAPHYFIPTNMTWWFAREHITNVSELPWWQKESINAITITAVPAKHWSRRGLFRTSDAGWGGYMIESPAGTIYFAGDTGYHDEYFKEIGTRFPHIDIGLIPIGAYYPQSFFGRFHVDPRQAVLVHKETGAKQSIGMHWGTFKLTQEPMAEPPILLAKEAATAGLSADAFTAMKIGETKIF